MDLFTRHDSPVLTPRSDVGWASGAVFNPGTWYADGTVHMLFRAVPAGYKEIMVVDEGDTEARRGFDDYVSYLGYASSRDGISFEWRDKPLIAPGDSFDRFGVEDARISRIGDLYFITYTALSKPAFESHEENGVRIGLATTSDFKTINRHGVIGPPLRDKDAVIFPRLFDGRVAMLHRLYPDIQIAWFDSVEDLCDPPADYWANYVPNLEDYVVMSCVADWEEKKIGAGPTPIETDEGWLLIYHGVDRNHVYRAGLALLDLEDPTRVIARTAKPVFEPEMPYELIGDVNNVVFPEGAAVIDDTLHMYYGAADRVVGLATASMSDVLAAVRNG
jgi:predicted GH43/DUF377 family glycosyl hydrolase